MRSKAIGEAVVKCLDDALKADPAAVTAMFSSRIPTNNKMKSHKHICTLPMEVFSNLKSSKKVEALSVLGIVNGILAAAELPPVLMMRSYEDNGMVLYGFCVAPKWLKLKDMKSNSTLRELFAKQGKLHAYKIEEKKVAKKKRISISSCRKACATFPNGGP
jgi:hypothetical protein